MLSRKAKQVVRKIAKAVAQEYITEADQEGPEYWHQFDSEDQIKKDFKLYCAMELNDPEWTLVNNFDGK